MNRVGISSQTATLRFKKRNVSDIILSLFPQIVLLLFQKFSAMEWETKQNRFVLSKFYLSLYILRQRIKGQDYKRVFEGPNVIF